MSLSRESILAAQDLQSEDMPVPEWSEGATLKVRGISAADFERFQAGLVGFRDDPAKASNIRCRFLVYCLVDDEGKRLFTEEDAAELGRKSPGVIARLYDKAQALSGLGPTVVEDAAKN
jgi:hypothetical protein